MAALYLIFISRHFDFGENLKNHFPIEIFNEIGFKLGDHENINITEIKCAYF